MKDRKDELLWPQKIIGTEKAWYYVDKKTIKIVVEPHERITTFLIGTKRLKRLLKMLDQN